MLKLKSFRQTPRYCGPASLKIVLEYFGVRKTEKEIVKLCHSTKAGTSAKQLVSAAKKLGFRGYVKDFANLSDIRKYIVRKIPVIVDWFSVDEGHYSVVAGISKNKIHLMDPELGRIRTMPLGVFKQLWFDFPGKFLRSKKEIVIRRMIVVIDKPPKRLS